MKVYSYSQARQNLAQVLRHCRTEPVLIRRRNGEVFRITVEPRKGSPLDVPSLATDVTTRDILAAVREGRERGGT